MAGSREEADSRLAQGSRAAEVRSLEAVGACHIPVGAGRIPEVVHSPAAVPEAGRIPVAVRELVLEAGHSRVAGSRRDWGYRPKDHSGRRGVLGVGS